MLPPEQRINSKDWNFAITEKVQGDFPPRRSISLIRWSLMLELYVAPRSCGSGKTQYLFQ